MIQVKNNEKKLTCYHINIDELYKALIGHLEKTRASQTTLIFTHSKAQ